MRIVTWNVNSIRKRLEKLPDWLAKWEPDALCLQETKVVDEDFPHAEIEACGYRAAVYGQKTYNGVAILTKADVEPQDVRCGFNDGAEEDPQARIIRATVGGVRIVNVYVVNGKAVGSDKYEYKLGWFERLFAMLDTQEDASAPLVLLGDFNVAPEDRDIHDPDLWRDKVHASAPERAALQRFIDWGLSDALRRHHEDEGIYSWWDYRGLAFQFRKGLRIDLVLDSAPLVARSVDCVVDKDARRGKGTSDHAPVVADYRD